MIGLKDWKRVPAVAQWDQWGSVSEVPECRFEPGAAQSLKRSGVATAMVQIATVAQI